MTKPTVIFFGPDKASGKGEPDLKVYLKTLLFSTSKRGRIVQSMHVTLRRNETVQNFNIWVHGDDRLVRGSGLFVGETGVAANHHFLLPRDGSRFSFAQGRYRMEVYAHLLGQRQADLLFSQELDITSEIAESLHEADDGLYFDLGADSSRYLLHVDTKPRVQDEIDLIHILTSEKSTSAVSGKLP